MTVTNKANPRGGPVTPRGRARSSMNAARHGLRASGLLMPGESVAAYRRHIASTLSALSPRDAAELQRAMDLGDVTWRLGRWLRVEHRASLEALENTMKKTQPYIFLSDVRDALTVLKALIEASDAVKRPVPAQKDSFLSGCRGCLNTLERISERPKRLAKFRHAVDRLDQAADDGFLDAYAEVAETAVELADELTRMVKPGEERLEKLRAELGAVTTPDEATMKKLTRYHGMLTKVANEQLDLVMKIRELTSRKRAEKRRGSFGTGENANSTRFLRVVR